VRASELKKLCLSDCTDPQREAIRHVSGPLLVLAGPGSGKTRVITRRIAYLVASGCRPDEILAITFTNKAAGEMRERVEALGVESGVWISTFHSFGARLLRVYGKHVGLRPSFSIYDTADSLAAIKRAMDALQIDKALFKPSYLAKCISIAKSRLLDADGVRASHMPDAETVARVYAKYTEMLRAGNAADFDDLLLLPVRLQQDVREVASTLQRRFRHVLIDEYQDTNHAQYVIAKNLAAGSGNICATGDPDQSIYGWRGADISNILRFEKDYPDARVVRLEQNFRSTGKILKAADDLISQNLARKEKALWTKNPEGEKVRMFRGEDENDEAAQVAAEIARMIGAGAAAPRDMAVFYRVNAQSRVLETALRFEAIPYTIVAGTEFFQRREVKDLLAYLRLVVNPADDVGALRVVNVPPRRVGATSVKRLREYAENRGCSLLEAMSHAQEAGVRGQALKGIDAFLKILGNLREMPACPVAPILKRLIGAVGYERHLEDASENSDERIANVRELVNAAAEYNQSEPAGDLLGFLEQAALISDVDTWDEDKGAVTLMTLHAAKGLEFPAVFIVGLEDGLLPLARDEVVHDLEEERRLFFVGITRAKRWAYLSMAEMRSRYGRPGYTTPSRFLSELPEEITQGMLDPAASASSERYNASNSHSANGPRFRLAGERNRPRRVKRSETEEIIYDGEEPDLGSSFAGCRLPIDVEHPTYGQGKLIGLSGYGEEAKATVRFPSVGVKRFVLRYARLRRI